MAKKKKRHKSHPTIEQATTSPAVEETVAEEVAEEAAAEEQAEAAEEAAEEATLEKRPPLGSADDARQSDAA